MRPSKRRAIRALFQQYQNVQDVALSLDCSPTTVKAHTEDLRAKMRENGDRAPRRRTPTPEEIAERAAAIRASHMAERAGKDVKFSRPGSLRQCTTSVRHNRRELLM